MSAADKRARLCRAADITCRVRLAAAHQAQLRMPRSYGAHPCGRQVVWGRRLTVLLQRLAIACDADPAKRITIHEIQDHPWYMKDLPPGVKEMNDNMRIPPQGSQASRFRFRARWGTK